ncbi:MAG: hypothetical protein V4613_11525 [Bacteroidota bacterium]
MNKIFLIVGLAVLLNTGLYAQKYSYYMGKKNMIGLTYHLPISQLYFEKGLSSIPFINGLQYERIVNKKYMLGIGVISNHYRVKDEFSNDGKNYPYHIDYNGESRKVNNGQGNVSVRMAAFMVNFKYFKTKFATVPLGRFINFKGGFSINRIAIYEDYKFSYTQYYGVLKKNYVVTEKQYLYFPKYHFGLEYGKAVRFMTDRLVFSYSLAYLHQFGKRYDSTGSLNDRFKDIAENTLKNNMMVTLNLNCSYAF